MGNLINAGKTSDIPEGEMKLVEIGEERILLSNIEGNFYAIGDTCSHAEASLSDGYIEGEEVECPFHGACFNLKTGLNTSPPAYEPVPCYPVSIQGDDILIETP